MSSEMIREEKNPNLLDNLKVLLVEDEELARNELAIFLKRRVGKLLTASNGHEGLEALGSIMPDIIITDLKMPVMGGIEFIGALRALGARCPVIVTSALSDVETILKAVDLGIVKYAVKPIDTSELVQLMNMLAVELLKEKYGQTLVDGSWVISGEQKKELEKQLKNEIAAFLKSTTGKGPREIHVMISGNTIEVKASGVLTLFETNLLKGKRNFSMVDYNRGLFYQENSPMLVKRLLEVTKATVVLVETKSDSEKDQDELIFLIS